MKNDTINEMIDLAISEDAETIDVKDLADKVANKVNLSENEVRQIVREKIQMIARTRIAKIKDANNIRNFFATPMDGRNGIYSNAPKSRDDIALERAAEVIEEKRDGLKISRDKLLSRVFQLRYNVEIKDDATFDTKKPYDEEKVET